MKKLFLILSIAILTSNSYAQYLVKYVFTDDFYLDQACPVKYNSYDIIPETGSSMSFRIYPDQPETHIYSENQIVDDLPVGFDLQVRATPYYLKPECEYINLSTYSNINRICSVQLWAFLIIRFRASVNSFPF